MEKNRIKHHPDTNRGNSEAGEISARIGQAWEKIKDTPQSDNGAGEYTGQDFSNEEDPYFGDEEEIPLEKPREPRTEILDSFSLGPDSVISSLEEAREKGLSEDEINALLNGEQVKQKIVNILKTNIGLFFSSPDELFEKWQRAGVDLKKSIKEPDVIREIEKAAKSNIILRGLPQIAEMVKYWSDLGIDLLPYINSHESKSQFERELAEKINSFSGGPQDFSEYLKLLNSSGIDILPDCEAVQERFKQMIKLSIKLSPGIKSLEKLVSEWSDSGFDIQRIIKSEEIQQTIKERILTLIKNGPIDSLKKVLGDFEKIGFNVNVFLKEEKTIKELEEYRERIKVWGPSVDDQLKEAFGDLERGLDDETRAILDGNI